MEAATVRYKEFDIERSTRSLGYNTVQRIGRVLTLPMLAMALMAFAAGVTLGIIRAHDISNGSSADTIETLKQVSAGFMTLGFASVFGAISFAIARILGQFRKGGGDLQEASGRRVETLKRPLTAWLFLGGMAMAMMTLVGAAVAHFVFATDITGSASSLGTSDDRFTVLIGIRVFGIATYLAAITLGLATIVHVLRFQSIRMRELPRETAQR